MTNGLSAGPDGSAWAPAQDAARRAVRERGRTYAQQAGVVLRDTPSPLYQLLVLTVLLANRLPADTAVGAATGVFRAGWRTPAAMVGSTWQERGNVLAASGYRRFAARTATVLGAGAEVVVERWGGDLRRLRDDAGGESSAVRRAVETVPGIGRLGSAIFCREVQGVWPQLAPFADERVVLGARALGLPTTGAELAALVPAADVVHLVAACVRASFGVPRADLG